MMPPGQLRAARALLQIDQKTLAARSGVSVPTIQRMGAREGVVRGNFETQKAERSGVRLVISGASSSISQSLISHGVRPPAAIYSTSLEDAVAAAHASLAVAQEKRPGSLPA